MVIKPHPIIFLVISLVLLGAACQKKLSLTNQPVISTSTSPVKTSSPSSVPVVTYQSDITAQVQPEEIALTGAGTQGLDVDPATGFVYLGNNGSVISKCAPIGPNQPGRDTMSIVDPVQKKEIARVATDGAPIWPTVDVQRDVVYMANSGRGTITVHQRGTGKKLQTIQIGGLPHMAGISGNLMVVANTFDKSQEYYSVVDLTTRKVIANYKSPHLPHPIVVDPAQPVAYMMGVQDGSVNMIDMTTGKTTETFTLTGAGGQLALSNTFKKFYTGSTQPGATAMAFDTTTRQPAGTANFTEIHQPGTSVIVDEDGGLVFIVIADANALGIADAATMQPLGWLKVGECPYGVRVDPTRGLGFVSNSGSHSLTMFDLKKVRAAVGK